MKTLEQQHLQNIITLNRCCDLQLGYCTSQYPKKDGSKSFSWTKTLYEFDSKNECLYENY